MGDVVCMFVGNWKGATVHKNSAMSGPEYNPRNHNAMQVHVDANAKYT